MTVSLHDTHEAAARSLAHTDAESILWSLDDHAALRVKGRSQARRLGRGS